MKLILSLWFSSLLCYCLSEENVVLKCGSPDCDAVISEARAHVQYHGNGIHIKRGDTVEILGRSNNKYLIQHKGQVALLSNTFFKESHIRIISDNLVNASDDVISKFFELDSKAPAKTPPLENKLTQDVPEAVDAPNAEEISSSKTYEVIDGTTLFLSDSDGDNATNDPVADVTTEAVVESAIDVSTESPASQEVQKDSSTEATQTGIDANTNKEPNATTEDVNQTDSEEILDDEESVDSTENEVDVELEVENLQNRVDETGSTMELVKNIVSFFSEPEDSSENSLDSPAASDGDQSPKKEEKSEGENVLVPSTAEVVSGSTESSAYYEPSPTVYPTKTVPPVQATAEVALPENAAVANSVEPSIAQKEDESLQPQDQIIVDVPKAETTDDTTTPANNIELATSNDAPSQEEIETTEESIVECISDPTSQSEITSDEAANATATELDDFSGNPVQVEPSFLPTVPTVEQATEVTATEKPLSSFNEQPVAEQVDGTEINEQPIVESESILAPAEQSSAEETSSVEVDQNESLSGKPLADEVEQPDLQEPKNENVDIASPDSSENSSEIMEPPVTSDTQPESVNQVGIDTTNITEDLPERIPEQVTETEQSEQVTSFAFHEDVTPSYTGTVEHSIANETSEISPEQTVSDDSLIVPIVPSPETNVSESLEAETTEELAKKGEFDAAPYPEQPVLGVYDSLIVAKPAYEPVTDDPSLVASPTEPSQNIPSGENDSTLDKSSGPFQELKPDDKIGTPENLLPPKEDDVLPPAKDVEETEGLQSLGIFGQVMDVYHSLSSIKESYMFGFMSKEKEEDPQHVWRSGKHDSQSTFDDTCKVEDLNCPSLKQLDHPSSPAMGAASSEIYFESLLQPLLGSTCLKAQGLVFFLTTAVVLVATFFFYLYFEKRSRDNSSFKKIDSLEKKLFIAEKEVLELTNKLSNSSGSGPSDSGIAVNSTHITELEAEREELLEKLLVLENESAVKSGLVKDLERRLQEALSMAQNTEMIFKTVDQLQQRIELQQRSISEMHAQLKNKDKTIEGLEESLEKAAVIKVQLEDMLAALKKENEALCIESSEKIIHLNSELDQVKSEKTLESTKLKAEIDSLKLSLEQARSSLDVAEASIVELKAIISDDAKNSDSLGDVFNGSELKAKLAVAELNIEKLKDRLQEESGARQFLEEHLTSVKEALEKLKITNSELEKEKQEAENAVKVLKDYFRKQEEELKKEIEEKSAFQLQKDEETLFIKMKTLEEEKGSLKEQIEEMKREILEQENLFKREKVQLEKKADDNWLLSRQINRKLQDAKQEAAVLRSRLTNVEKLLTEKNENDPNNEQSVTNGEGMSQNNISSPSMLLNFPNTANSSFAKYNSSDLILPPPLGMPGNEFIPPPPINFPDLRLPPLGSVGRIPSPPSGMSPPLSLETNFGINFSPPPPMPPQYYYYHRSDSPSDYDDSSYSKGENYRDSPMNLERSGSSKAKSDPMRKPPTDQADSYPSSNPSHPSPLKPVARNPTSSGQKGWSSSGQSNKPVEKNSRKPGR
ncbi:unnamed protein product [Bemisia tabaci]|uniref:Transport and Golgi organization protein 1 n=1 Tax=Bemisia tabaci TaxID=7038 RepID=A0A9P0ALA8_BEMTA|nr:unnamed protein product [Bemisia tabaci]